jgi:hypothetical protein
MWQSKNESELTLTANVAVAQVADDFEVYGIRDGKVLYSLPAHPQTVPVSSHRIVGFIPLVKKESFFANVCVDSRRIKSNCNSLTPPQQGVEHDLLQLRCLRLRCS